MYRTNYLPIAQQDLIDIATYIANNLHNPSAAERISTEIATFIDGLGQFPYSHPVYIPIKPLQQEYRKIVVHNYTIFYWVDEPEKSITIARILYARRDHTDLMS